MHFKGTTSIKMREIDDSHAKETSFIGSLVIHQLNTKKLLVVLHCQTTWNIFNFEKNGGSPPKIHTRIDLRI